MQSALGLAVVGGAGEFLLQPQARATPSSGTLGSYAAFLDAEARGLVAPEKLAEPKWQATEDNILGPYYRAGSPFRGKVTPPLEPGKVMHIKGRVWGLDTKRPLAGVVLDIWQANDKGRYDNDDPKNPPKEGVFVNRTRLLTDEHGYYEFETVHPGRYQIGDKEWRPAHIHYLVRHPKYKQLVTQLYFEGDPYNKTDSFIKPSLIIGLKPVKTPGGVYHSGTFDIVLAKQ
jgi:protocatechuate 3,4-dioxygenase beta subunit